MLTLLLIAATGTMCNGQAYDAWQANPCDRPAYEMKNPGTPGYTQPECTEGEIPVYNQCILRRDT